MEIFLGDGEGGFTLAGTQETGADGDIAMAVTTRIADFRGDGSNDVAITNYAGQAEVYLSDGDGAFTKGPIVRLGGCGCKDAWGISPADLNGDGRDDLSVAIFAESQVATLIAQPDGSMLISQINTNPLAPDPNFPDGVDAQPKMVGNGDLNGDGIPEMVSADTNGDSITINSGLASGAGYQFADNISMPGVIDARYISSDQGLVDDFNGDGKGDVIVGSVFHKNVLFTNNGQLGQVPLPATLDFGNVVTGTPSEPETVELKHEDGPAALIVNNVSIGGGESADFTIVDDSDCLAAPILVGDSCTVELTFDPNGPPGARSSQLFFDTNNEDVTQIDIPLSGTAESDDPSGSVAPTSVSYGQVSVGVCGPARGFDLTNTGFVPLDTDGVTLEGTDAADFSVGAGCSDKLLAPAATCTITADFTPAAAGARSASVQIASNAQAGVILVPLSGTGVVEPVLVPEISVKPVSVAFASRQVGSQSGEKSFVVTSSGTAPLVLGAITRGGTDAGDFPAGSNGCSGTLRPAATCSISYRFKPKAAGKRSAAVAIASNATGGSATVPLSGAATQNRCRSPGSPSRRSRKRST